MKDLIVIAFIALLFGCASMANNTVTELSLRTLYISNEFPGFEYQYFICTKKFLGFCRNWEKQVDKYDLSDLTIRKQLKDMGFVARVKEKPLPTGP